MSAARFLLPLLSVCIATTAMGQRPARRGFWAAFGLGYGSNSMSCASGCSFNDEAKGGAPTAAIKLGGTPRPNLRLGGEINLWVKDVNGVTESVGNVSGAVYLYPSPKSGFFVKGGAGVASYQISQGSNYTTASGFGLVMGIGYDIQVGRKVALSPIANFYWGHDGDISDQSGTVPGIKHSIIDVGVSIQYN